MLVASVRRVSGGYGFGGCLKITGWQILRLEGLKEHSVSTAPFGQRGTPVTVPKMLIGYRSSRLPGPGALAPGVAPVGAAPVVEGGERFPIAGGARLGSRSPPCGPVAPLPPR